MNEIKNKVLKAEYIGLLVKIIGAKNKTMIGIEGTIIDETKNMITIATTAGTKQVIKKDAVLQIQYDKKKINLRGDLINKRPEERIKIK